jgi:magnesium-transporting ATPase (P-type)
MSSAFFSYTWAELQELFDDLGNFEALEKLGGLQAIAKGLHIDIKKGVVDDAGDRAATFDSNVYPERKHTGFFMLMWEALQDVTLIILCIAAVISLALGIAFPNEEEGETRATGTLAALFYQPF